MTFVELKARCCVLGILLHKTTGRELIRTVSVDEPLEPRDELHFYKLVSWCYVFVFEASQPTTRYVLSLLRASRPDEHRTVSSTFELVNYLRTARVHNLSVESKGDDHKRRQAQIWLVQNGGEPLNWTSCCQALCAQVNLAIKLLAGRWYEVTSSVGDSESIVSGLIFAIDRDWPAHSFDRIIEDAAAQIGLVGLDVVKYRESRLTRWRELASLFEVREHADAALSAAIRREMENTFGSRTTL